MTQFFLHPRPGRGRQVRCPALILAATVALCPAFGFSAEPESVLETLRAADTARQTNATEAQAWAEEKARLELLLTTLRERTAAARRARTKAQQALRALTAKSTRPPVVSLETATIRTGRQIDDALDALAKQVPPGLIPARSAERANPREALDRALHRLERAERALRTVVVSVAPGRLDGEPKSVEVVRLGGVAAWWRSLDGASGGEAQMIDGELRLYRVDDDAVLEAIAKASAIAKGRAAPEIVLLPIQYARTSTESTP